MNTRVLDFLRVMSKNEHELFGQYLHFPPFNTNDKLAILFEGLMKYAPAFALQSKDWENTFDKMWPNRSFEMSELRAKLSLLLTLLKTYLSQEALRQNPQQEAFLCLSELRKRGLQKAFEITARKLERQLDSQQMESVEDNYLRYRIADEANSLYGQRQLRKFDSSLQAKIDNLDVYYLRVRLRESCELLNRHQVLNTHYEPDFFDNWISQLAENHALLEKIPTLAVYMQIFICYRQPDDATVFEKLQEQLTSHAGLFPPEEARGLYRHAQNYCIRRINIGKLIYSRELFLLYQQQLDRGLILVQGELDHSDFKNIVTVAIRLKEFTWAIDFIEKYRSLVSPDYRDNVYHFCKADMHYAQGQSGEAIRLLQEVTFTDVFYQLSARTLLIKIYYEISETEGLYYALEAFERFLRRNKKLIKTRRESQKSFINLCRRLAKLRERKPLLTQKEFLERKKLFLIRLSEAGRLSNLDWLEEKAALV